MSSPILSAAKRDKVRPDSETQTEKPAVHTVASVDGKLSLNEFSRDQTIFDSGAQLGKASASVPMSGSSEFSDGAVVEARAVSADDNGAMTTPWSKVGVVSKGKWLGTIEVPRSKYWFYVEARVGDSPSSRVRAKGRFASGHVWAIYEQSNWAHLLQNRRGPQGDPLTNPGDVWIFKRDGSITEIANGGEFPPSLAALANALSAERSGEKFAIAFHTQSGTSPEDMLTRSDEDKKFGTKGERNWEDELVLHKNITADGSPVGLVTINGWISFGAGKPAVARLFSKYFLGKDIDGTPTTPEAEGVPRFMTEIYDWSYSRLAWIGPHGRNNNSVEGAVIKSSADLPGYGSPANKDYEALVDNLRANFGQPHLPETLPFAMETIGGQRGCPRGDAGWSDFLHYNGTSKDGLEMLARLGMAATLKTVGLVGWTVPKFDRRYDDPAGAYVEFWIDGCDVTTLRRLRAANGTLGDYPAKIPATYPHRTEVMGWEIDGRPAERAEIVRNAGGSTFDGVRVYPNAGSSNFTEKTETIYGPGSYVGRQITVDDPRDGIHLNYPVADVGQKDLPALPVQPRSTGGIPNTLTKK